FTANTITINGSLTLTSGLMAGNITLGNPAAALTYTPTSYIVGTLKRTISSPGIYTFPIGAADRFALVTLNINSITGTQNIAAAFTSTINGAVPNTTAQGVPVTELLNSGIWTITPNTQPTALSYTITLEGRNHTNGVTDAARYVVLRRDASYYAWGFYGNNGLATQNAGVVNATGSMTGFFREYGIGIASSGVGNVLPLNLISFTAIKKDANVLLQWKTTNEVNTKQALIQHSTDAITWTPIGRIASNNNSVNNYSFLHTQPANGTNYYRLLLQDLNGNSTFSDIRRINLDTKVMLRAYPNPVLNNGLTIDVGQFIDKALNYLVLDYAGRIVKTGKIENQQQHILLQDLLPGMYLLKVSNGTVIKFEKK
ncbi:MAG: T9SS type A sorting domain-containing protein, partial [Ferruginibacter sp.]